MNIIKIKPLTGEAYHPLKAHESDSGYDLHSIDTVHLFPGEFKLIHTGIALGLPQGVEAQIRPRSGLALKHGITVLNSPGTIDESFTGEIGVILINHNSIPYTINKGDRIAQMVFAHVLDTTLEVVSDIPETDRGSTGFGDSGK